MKDFINSKKGKITLICVLLLIIAAVLLLFVFNREKGYRSISVSEVVGSVMTENDGKEYEAYQNMRIAGGYALTTDSDSYTRMVLDDDKYVKLEQLSRAKFEELGNDKQRNTIIRLEQGAITNEIAAPLAEDEDYIVNTPNAVLAVRGTFFRVEVRYDVNGDAYTNVYAYGGTVVCRRVMPDGTVVDEEVEITAGYKARIKMDEIVTIYIEDRIEEEEDNVDPIELSEITDWDIVDMYNASIHGHELFVDSGELWDEIDDRDIEIDEYTSAYDEEEIEEYPDYQQRTGANNNKNNGNDNGNNGNENGKDDDKNGNKDGNGNNSDDENDADSENGNGDGNGGNDVGNGNSDNGNQNGNDGNNGSGNDSDDRNDNGNNGNNGNGGNGNHNGWEENDGNDNGVPDDNKSDPSNNEKDNSDDRNDNGNNGNNGNGGNGNHNGWEENDNNDKDDSDDKSDNDKSAPSDDKDDSDDKSDDNKSAPSDDKDNSDGKSDDNKSDPSDDKDKSDDKSDNDKSDPSDDKDDSDDKSDDNKSDPSDDKDDSDDNSGGNSGDKFPPVHTHSFGEYVSDNNATCTEDGTKTAVCSCGEKDTVVDEGSAKGHTEKEEITPATATAEGLRRVYCTVCGETLEKEVLPVIALVLYTEDGSITIRESGYEVKKENNTYINDNYTGAYLISQRDYDTVAECSITVESGKHDITLDGINIYFNGTAFKVESGAEITLNGTETENIIANDVSNGFENNGTAAITGGIFTFTDSQDYGIYNTGTLKISGGEIKAGAAVNGVMNEGGSIEISGGKLTVNKWGLNNSENSFVTVSGGTLGLSYESYNDGSIIVNSGEFAAKSHFENNGSIAVNGGSFKVNNGTLYNNGDFTLANGNVEIKECDSEGIVNTGTFNANGGKLVCECENFSIQNENTFTVNGAEVELNIAIWNQGDFTIGSGKFTINTEYEAVSNEKNIYINGGTVNINCDIGIDNRPDTHMEINDGTIEINAMTEGVVNDGQLIINGGKLTVICDEGEYTHGIRNSGTMQVNDGDINISATEAGMENAGSLSVSGGRINISCESPGNCVVNCAKFEINGGSMDLDGSFNNNPYTMYDGYFYINGGSVKMNNSSDIDVTNSGNFKLKCVVYGTFPTEAERTFTNSDSTSYIYALTEADKADDGKYYVWKPASMDEVPFDGKLYIEDGSVKITETGYTQGDASEETPYTRDYVISQRDSSAVAEFSLTIEGSQKVTLDKVNIKIRIENEGGIIEINDSAIIDAAIGNRENSTITFNGGSVQLADRIGNKGLITVNGTNIECVADDIGLENYGEFILNSGTVKMDEMGSNDGSFTISGGTLIIERTGSQLDNNGEFTVNGGTLTADSVGFCNNDSGIFNLSSGSMSLYHVNNDGETNISGGELSVLCEDGTAIFNDGKFTVNDGLLNINGAGGIGNGGNFVINGGEIIIEADDPESWYSGAFENTNGGTVEVNGGKLKISGDDVGIFNESQFAINGGRINISYLNNAQEPYNCGGIFNCSSFEISGGAVEISGDGYDINTLDTSVSIIGGSLKCDSIMGSITNGKNNVSVSIFDTFPTEAERTFTNSDGTTYVYALTEADKADNGKYYVWGPVSMDEEEFDGTLYTEDGSITITETGYIQGENAEVAYTGDYVISQHDSANSIEDTTITVSSGTHNIYLDNVYIYATENLLSISDGATANISGSAKLITSSTSTHSIQCVGTAYFNGGEYTIDGADIQGNLIITGGTYNSTAKLKINNGAKLAISGGTLNFSGINLGFGIYNDGTVEISGGNIALDTNTYAILTWGDITISGGSVTADGGTYDIFGSSGNTFVVTGGTLKSVNNTISNCTITNSAGDPLECVIYDTFPTESERTFTNSDGTTYVYALTEADKADDGKYYVWKPVSMAEATGIAIDSTNFPDTAFCEYVSSSFDIDNNGYLSDEEINSVTNMQIWRFDVASLDGIEHFTELTELICSSTNITSLDISENKKLTNLNCSYTDITNIDVSNNLSLTHLNCGNTNLTSLDVSNNTSLNVLDCSYTQLTSLDVSNNTELTSLNCFNTGISSLDISNNSALNELDCCYTNITELDVDNNAELKILKCQFTGIINIDVSKNILLTELDMGSTNLTSVDVSNNAALTVLNVGHTSLINLDVSNNTELTHLYCGDTGITTLDVSNNTALVHLWCDGIGITTLDVSNNTSLINLYCSSTGITSLDVSKNIALTTLYCDTSALAYIDLTNNPNLTSFSASGNKYVIPSNAAEFDGKTIAGFDPGKVSNVTGADFDSATGMFTNIISDISYTYECGQGYSTSFILTRTGAATTSIGVLISDEETEETEDETTDDEVVDDGTPDDDVVDDGTPDDDVVDDGTPDDDVVDDGTPDDDVVDDGTPDDEVVEDGTADDEVVDDGTPDDDVVDDGTPDDEVVDDSETGEGASDEGSSASETEENSGGETEETPAGII